MFDPGWKPGPQGRFAIRALQRCPAGSQSRPAQASLEPFQAIARMPPRVLSEPGRSSSRQGEWLLDLDSNQGPTD
jgi:hypothetical protein